jgi:hypothetical protein
MRENRMRTPEEHKELCQRTRNKDGRWRKKRSDAGKPRKKKDQCPKCRTHQALVRFDGELINGTSRLWVCKRCGFKSIRKDGGKEE